MTPWVGSDYSQAIDEELIVCYESVLNEITKRFSKRKSKKR